MSSKDFNKFVDSEEKKNAKRGVISDTVKNTIIGGIITLVGIIITYIVAPNINNIIQAQQTQSAIALTQNAPTATTITAIPISTDTPIPGITPTETTAPTNTDTPIPTVTNTDTPQLTETIQPGATIDLVAMRAATLAVQRTETREALIAQQTADALVAAEDSTATANAIASFTKTPAPTATVTLGVVRQYPCQATVTTSSETRFPTYRLPNGTQNLNDYRRSGKAVTLYAAQRDENNRTWYRINPTSETLQVWIEAKIIEPSTQCPNS